MNEYKLEDRSGPGQYEIRDRLCISSLGHPLKGNNLKKDWEGNGEMNLRKLQRVQNCLARVVTRSPRFTPSKPLLKSLHWLPVQYRIMFKMCTITYQALSSKQPSYLHTLLTPIRKPIQLRSSTSDLLLVPKVNTNMGTRAFAVGAPTLWNMLPSSVKSVENIAKFRRHLKTYLYNLAYPP